MAGASGKIVLRIDHLSKEFPGVKALDDVSMEFREGEVHCLIGENGAGKSTLIKAIAGYHAPTSGTITVHGKEYSEMTVPLAAECGIQVIYQEFNNVPPLTAAENVFLGVRTNPGLFVDFEGRRKAAKELFQRLGVIRTGIIALGVYTGAYMGEVVRAAIEAVPKGQFEAAQAQGFNYLQRMGYIILPQSIPVMLPPMVNQVVNLFKNTSCLYIVGGADLISVTYSFVTGASTGGAYAPAYIVCGLIFFVVCFPLSTLATRWEASLKERKGKADPALRAVKRTALKEAA